MKSTISPKETDRSQNELYSLRRLKPDQLAELVTRVAQQDLAARSPRGELRTDEHVDRPEIWPPEQGNIENDGPGRSRGHS